MREGWRIVIEAADGQPLWPQGFGPHPLLNRVRRGVVAGLASPKIGEKEGLVSIQSAGFTARFKAASVQRKDHEVVVRL